MKRILICALLVGALQIQSQQVNPKVHPADVQKLEQGTYHLENINKKLQAITQNPHMSSTVKADAQKIQDTLADLGNRIAKSAGAKSQEIKEIFEQLLMLVKNAALREAEKLKQLIIESMDAIQQVQGGMQKQLHDALPKISQILNEFAQKAGIGYQLQNGNGQMNRAEKRVNQMVPAKRVQEPIKDKVYTTRYTTNVNPDERPYPGEGNMSQQFGASSGYGNFSGNSRNHYGANPRTGGQMGW